jgi:hypothetical protein
MGRKKLRNKKKRQTRRSPSATYCAICGKQTCNSDVCSDHTYYLGNVWVLEVYRGYGFWYPKWDLEEKERLKRLIDSHIEKEKNKSENLKRAS